MNLYYISVDVGTTSVRAAIFTVDGKQLSTEITPIKIWNDCTGNKPVFFEQSSQDIWCSVTKAVQGAVNKSGVSKDSIVGLGFDATCSLVILDESFRPLPVDTHGINERNIIMWMDHRATSETELINSTKSKYLNSVGGKISVEMHLPKIMWLKKNVPSTWEKCSHLFDLSDFLTWRATHSLSRSVCSYVCKSLYFLDETGASHWPTELFQQLDLDDLYVSEDHKIGSAVQYVGEKCGNGLTEEAAASLGLNVGTAVGTAITDAHAGCIGSLACDVGDRTVEMTDKLVMTCGTSTCHLAVGSRKMFVPGIWGPYYSVIFPDKWVNEAGQSAAGSLINHVVKSHPAYANLPKHALTSDAGVFSYLHGILDKLRQTNQLTSISPLTQHLHVWPDYLGNRSPLADNTLTGMISGLTLSTDVNDLACLYLATIQSLAYGTQHILDKFKENGRIFKVIIMCGGLSKNDLYVQTHADVTGVPVIVPEVEDTVLLGSAAIAAKASGQADSLEEAIQKMQGPGRRVTPKKCEKSYHDKKYKVFLKMMNDQLEYQRIMSA